MFRLTAPAKQARPGPPLAPILGQHQIKVVDFIAEFNRLAGGYAEGVPLGCRVRRLPGPNRFTLRVVPPSWTTLLTGAVGPSGGVDPATLWAALHLRGCPTRAGARTVLGTLRSCRLRLS